MGTAPAGYEEEVAPPANSPHLQAGSMPAGYDEEVPAPQASLLSRGWDFVNRGLISPETFLNAAAMVAPKPPDMQPGESVTQYLTRGRSAIDPNHPIMAGIRAGLSGAALDTANTVSSFTSPASLALGGSAVASRALPEVGAAARAGRVALRAGQLGAAGAFGAKGAQDVVQAGTENTPEAWAQRLQGGAQMAGGAAGAADVMRESAPSLKWARQGRAAMNTAYADLPIKPLQSYGAANELVNNLDQTADPVPPQLRAFVLRNSAADIPQAHPEVAAQLQDQGIPTHNPLSFPEANNFRTSLSRLRFAKELPSDTAKQIGHVAKLLDQDIRASAPHDAFLQDYDRFNKEYAAGKAMQRGARKIGGAVGGAVGSVTGYELGRLTGIPHLPWVLGGAGYAVGQPVIGGMVESVLERPHGAPDLTPPKLPPSKLPREAYTRIMLRAKGEIPGEEISTTKANQMVAGSPPVRRITPPPTAPAPTPPDLPTGWNPQGGKGGLSNTLKPAASMPIPSPEYDYRVGGGPMKASDAGVASRKAMPEIPRMTPGEMDERRAANRTPEEHLLDKYWAQARQELGDNASSDAIAARVQQLAGKRTKVNFQTRRKGGR